MLGLGGRGATSAQYAGCGDGGCAAEQYAAAHDGVESGEGGEGLGAHDGLLVGVDCADAVLAVWGWLRMLGRRGFRLQERLLSAVMGGQVKPCKIM